MSLSFDKALPRRIKMICETEEKPLDVDSIVDHLQRLYRNDYSRRKRNAFRKLVSKVHEDLLKGGDVKKEESYASSNEEEDLVEYQNTNMMNASLSTIYSNIDPPKCTQPPSSTPLPYEPEPVSGSERKTPNGQHNRSSNMDSNENFLQIKPKQRRKRSQVK
uniref:NVL2 nucleolin binding domain-containing protein n=1 Tax=Ciona savignyi TaxID=51511 RepID=H2Z3Q9_CIOSA